MRGDSTSSVNIGGFWKFLCFHFYLISQKQKLSSAAAGKCSCVLQHSVTGNCEQRAQMEFNFLHIVHCAHTYITNGLSARPGEIESGGACHFLYFSHFFAFST
jgi:hypothetical protein